MRALRRLVCAILGHRQPVVDPSSWWFAYGWYVGPCRRCGLACTWRLLP